MKEFRAKVAVVTGAASGIGRALAHRFAAEGMKVVLADIEMEALAAVESELKAMGHSVLAVRTDVAEGSSVQALAEQTSVTFGAVHILCNNAGVIDMADRPVWETPLDSLEWLMGVNLWGVIHGVRAFVPLMLKQHGRSHVVNTASIAGLLADGHYGLYNTTKHAVVALSESMYLALVAQNAPVRVSVLCPGFVNTRFVDAARNRPSSVAEDAPAVRGRSQERSETMSKVLQQGMSPARIADLTLAAIRDDRFYILPHSDFKPGIRMRMENILTERNPASSPPTPDREVNEP